MTKIVEDELFAVAKLGAPKGVNGFLKLHSYSGEFGHLKKLKEVLLAPEKQPDLGKKAQIRATEGGVSNLSMAFVGYDTPEKARALTGMELFLPRSSASPLKKNEWYIRDLIGLNLVFLKEKVGVIEAVLDGGADPLLEVRLAASGGTILVPFRNGFVGAVDCEAGFLELTAGWLLE